MAACIFARNSMKFYGRPHIWKLGSGLTACPQEPLLIMSHTNLLGNLLGGPMYHLASTQLHAHFSTETLEKFIKSRRDEKSLIMANRLDPQIT